MRRSDSRRGVVLVVVSVWLALLWMVAALFVTYTMSTRLAVGVSIDSVRAVLLACSGVEYALARLSRQPEPVPALGRQRDDWTYRESDPSMPVEGAHNPSWAHGEPYRANLMMSNNGRYDPALDVFTPALHDRNGNDVHDGWTGRLRGSYHPYGDTFSLRVEDESAKINVNGGLLGLTDRDTAGPGFGVPDHCDPDCSRGWNAQLRRVLNVLGRVREDSSEDVNGNGILDIGEDADRDGVLDLEDRVQQAWEEWNGNGALDPAPVDVPRAGVDPPAKGLGDYILENRPPCGYASVAQVQRMLEEVLGRPLPDLRPYLTAHSWVDRKVIRPNAGNAADFDGYVGLAGVQVDHLPPVAGAEVRFVHHFDDSWTADAGVDVSLQTAPVASSTSLQQSASVSAWPRNPTVEEPNTLLPDGMHQQLNRCPAYYATNLPIDSDPQSDHGVVSFWTKRPSVENRTFLDFVCVRNRLVGGVVNAMHLGVGGGALTVGIQVKNWTVWGNGNDPNHERGMSVRFNRSQTLPSGGGTAEFHYAPCLRWNLVTAFYDTDTIVQTSGLDVDTRVKGLSVGTSGQYAWNFWYTLSGAEKLAEPDPNLVFFLGPPTNGQSLWERAGFLADQVMDELVLYDFRDNASVARVDSDGWSDYRYANGRYYKGAAEFLSPVVRSPDGAPIRLQRAFWTQVLPDEERLESVRGGNADTTNRIYPRVKDPNLLDALGQSRARIEVDLLDETGGTPLLDGAGDALTTIAQGAALGTSVPAFRYRLRFQTDLADPINHPVLETPVFDDITFVIQRASGPQILAWTGP